VCVGVVMCDEKNCETVSACVLVSVLWRMCVREGGSVCVCVCDVKCIREVVRDGKCV